MTDQKIARPAARQVRNKYHGTVWEVACEVVDPLGVRHYGFTGVPGFHRPDDYEAVPIEGVRNDL